MLSRLGFSVEANTISALSENLELLEEVVSSRLNEELRKDLIHPCVLEILQSYSRYGVLHYLLPNLNQNSEALWDSSSELYASLKRYSEALSSELIPENCYTFVIPICIIVLHTIVSKEGEDVLLRDFSRDEWSDLVDYSVSKETVSKRDRWDTARLLLAASLIRRQASDIGQYSGLFRSLRRELYIFLDCMDIDFEDYHYLFIERRKPKYQRHNRNIRKNKRKQKR